MSDLKTSTVQLTPEQIEELRQNPDNVVYDVTHDEVEYTPMAQVKQTLGVIRTLAQHLRKENPEWSDARVRQEIRSRSQAAETMASSTHPRLFETITRESVDDKTAEMIGYMISLHERVERGEMTKEESSTALYVKMLQENKQ
tara:strand:- start:44 stop:472 length:429 start_codon:yes stop_codon:yes gene_type:complete